MQFYVYNEGRLGNNLFQYFFAKIISKKTNSEFFTSFSLPNEFGLDYKQFNDKPHNACKLTEEWQGPKVTLKLNSDIIPENLDIICDSITKLNCQQIELKGYFQQCSYYISERQFIKNSFTHNFDKQENTLGIHVRKGDITNTINDLPDLWFIEMVKKYPNHKKFVTTDSPNSNVVRQLLNLGCELYQNTPEKTILEFSTFSDLILSQGTFSWWMAFLCDGNKNFLIPSTGWNSDNSSINLLPKETNWNYYKLINNTLQNDY
jgi:hypothetical protein